MCVRENAIGTAIAQRMDWPAHLFANAIMGMLKTRIRRRRRTLTDSRSSAKSLVDQYIIMPVLITIGILLTCVTVNVSCCMATSDQ